MRAEFHRNECDPDEPLTFGEDPESSTELCHACFGRVYRNQPRLQIVRTPDACMSVIMCHSGAPARAA